MQIFATKLPKLAKTGQNFAFLTLKSTPAWNTPSSVVTVVTIYQLRPQTNKIVSLSVAIKLSFLFLLVLPVPQYWPIMICFLIYRSCFFLSYDMFPIKVSSTSPTSPVPSTRTTASTRYRHIIPKSGLKIQTKWKHIIPKSVFRIHTKSKHTIPKSGLQMATCCRTRCSSSPTGRSWAPPSSPCP